ncbi:hypothetical protein BgiMline_000464, partial [Biomphalaria glabrata]
ATNPSDTTPPLDFPKAALERGRFGVGLATLTCQKPLAAEIPNSKSTEVTDLAEDVGEVEESLGSRQAEEYHMIHTLRKPASNIKSQDIT